MVQKLIKIEQLLLFVSYEIRKNKCFVILCDLELNVTNDWMSFICLIL